MVLSLFRRLTGARADRRREARRSRIDGRVRVEGRHYSLKDWSRRGFSVVGVAPDFYPGDRIALSVEVDLPQQPLSFDCQAVVVWVDRERKELAGVFTDLDLHVQERIMRELVARPVAEGGLAAPRHA